MIAMDSEETYTIGRMTSKCVGGVILFAHHLTKERRMFQVLRLMYMRISTEKTLLVHN